MEGEKNPNAHLTAKERERPSWPTRKLYARGLIEGEVLDFGCGYGADVEFLAEKGFQVTGYDPHYAPEYPTRQFDTILCQYVLNVLFPKAQSRVLMQVSELLRPSGQAFFTVRRDVRRPGFRMHKKHRRRTYQCNVVLPFESALRTDFCQIYRYRHYNRIEARQATGCPFCKPEPERELLTESAQTYAMLDKYPVTEGHALVIPKRHVSSYFDLSAREQTACWMVVNRTRERLQERFEPDGFNVGINVARAAGQTVGHVHIHVIPRYEGDVVNPIGGVRNVIPEKGDYRT